MNRIVKKFSMLKDKDQKAFIPFITLGYPDMESCVDLVLELERRGADIIELGVPFSDPLADGPVIQTASFEALKEGITLDKAIKFVGKVRERTCVPVVLMGYYNPIFRFGEKEFVHRASAAGVDGLIMADLPPEEAKGVQRYTGEKDLALIFLLTPISSDERIKLVCSLSRGFIYCVSYTGVTGKGKGEERIISSLLSKVRSCSRTPLAVGFGVSSPSQAKRISCLADGVIVGSAIIRKIMENKHKQDMVNKVGEFAFSLCRAVKESSSRGVP